jgi:hypothetical protein
MTGLTAGLGVRFKGFGLDYAFQPYGDLATSHRIALIWTGVKPEPFPAATAGPDAKAGGSGVPVTGAPAGTEPAGAATTTQPAPAKAP